MSQHTIQKRRTAPDIQNRKGGEPIVALTSYHAHTAAIADKYVDFLLVGDSLGMVMHGFESTLPVPLDLMIMHGRAVMRGAKQSLDRGGHAFRLLRGKPATGLPQRRPRCEGNRVWRHQARRRQAHGRDHPFSLGTRHPRHGPCGSDAAVHQRAGRLQGAGSRARTMGSH